MKNEEFKKMYEKFQNPERRINEATRSFFKEMGKPEWVRIMDFMWLFNRQVDFFEKDYKNRYGLKIEMDVFKEFVENVFWGHMENELLAIFTKEQLKELTGHDLAKICWPNWDSFTKDLEPGFEDKKKKFWDDMYEIFIREPVEKRVLPTKCGERVLKSWNDLCDESNENAKKNPYAFFSDELLYSVFHNCFSSLLISACQIENDIFGTNEFLNAFLKEIRGWMRRALKENRELDPIFI